MKLKLFGKNPSVVSFAVLAGGYDAETARMSFVVKGEDETAGVLLMDPAEARRMGESILATAPTVTRVDDSRPLGDGAGGVKSPPPGRVAAPGAENPP